MDRDANAARNILLTNSSLFGFTSQEALGLTPPPSSRTSVQSAWSHSKILIRIVEIVDLFVSVKRFIVSHRTGRMTDLLVIRHVLGIRLGP
jgi:hypothetical protein